MITVFLSHSSQDKPFVRELAAFLETQGDVTVWLDERQIAPGQNIVARLTDGLESDFILLILSPDSVASAWVSEEWTDAFWDQTNRRRPKLAAVLYRDCSIPRLLRNKKYFDLRTNHPQGFREIHSFLITRQPTPPPRVNQLPTRPPVFIGRERELAALRERLGVPGAVVHIPAMPGIGKTTLALEFAHRYQNDFESVYWLPCQSQSLAFLAGELARLLGLKLEGELAQAVRDLKDLCVRRRCLLILDGVDNDSPGDLVPGGASSVLVTTRHPTLPFLRFHGPIELPLFSETQCFELFIQVVGAQEVERHRTECQSMFRRLGCLPLGVSISAGLIRYDVRYTIAGLAANLPHDVTALIREAIQALDMHTRHLLAAMAACAPEGFGLEMAATIASQDSAASLDCLQQLVSRSLAEELDRDSRRYRLHNLVREAATDPLLAPKHTSAICTEYKTWESNWNRCIADLPDFRVALETALADGEAGVDPLADQLAKDGFRLTHRVGRLAEAFEICVRMHRAAAALNDRATLAAWLGNEGEILRLWGRLDEAVAAFKQQETILLDLGDMGGLAPCYVRQSLVLWIWGRLEEALALQERAEVIFLQLGNKDGLERNYVNQAGALMALERFEDALALYKKAEAICLELGNTNDLAASYDGQAAILNTWGRREEAMDLLKREEAICLELGNKEGLQRCYGNQAEILRDLGRFEDAMVLLRKQEGVCEELGNKLALGYCYFGWGLTARALGNSEEGLRKLRAALTLFAELPMPRERDKVAAEITKTEAEKVS